MKREGTCQLSVVTSGAAVLVSVASVVPWRAVSVTTDADGKPATAHVIVQDLPMKQPPTGPAGGVEMATTVTRTVADDSSPDVSVTVKLKSCEPTGKPVTVVTAASGDATVPEATAAHTNVKVPPVRDVEAAALSVMGLPSTTATLGATSTGGRDDGVTEGVGDTEAPELKDAVREALSE